MKRAVALVAIYLAATACQEGKNPVEQTGDPQLVLSMDSVTVDVGTSTLVGATVRNTREPAQFVSRDQSVATVNASGAISGVAIGSTYVVATLSNRADVRDSVRVRVQGRTSAVDTCLFARPDFGGAATAADRALFSYDINAPLNLKTTVDSTRNGVEFNSISYDSPAGGSVPGIMYRPVGRSGLRPGVVVMAGSGSPTGPVQGARVGQFEMRALAERGAVAIGIDYPYARRKGSNPPTLLPQDRPEHIQLLKDLQRAVDVLLAQGNVDPARMGFAGYSFGGMAGVAFAGIERRLKAGVITAGYGGSVTAATNQNVIKFWSTGSCASRNAWLRDNVPIEPIRFIPGAAPIALLFQIARFDNAVLPDDAQAVYDAAPSPKEVLYYDAGHGFNAQATTDRYAWLSKQIGIDP